MSAHLQITNADPRPLPAETSSTLRELVSWMLKRKTDERASVQQLLDHPEVKRCARGVS